MRSARAVTTTPRFPGDPRLRRVLVAYGLSRFTEFAGWLTVLLVAYHLGGATLVGLSAFAMQAPTIALVPVLAAFADRMPRGQALTVSHAAVAVSTAAVAGLLLIDAPWWIVLVGGTIMTTSVCLVRPMHFATLPLISKGPADLVAANGWSSFMDGGAIFVGFALAGVVTEALGAWVVLLTCALFSVAAVGLTWGLNAPVAAVSDGDSASELRAALVGFAALRRTRGAFAVLLLMASCSVIIGSNEPLTIAFNDEVLHYPEATAGLVAGAFGVGVALGGLGSVGLARRRYLAPVVLTGALVLGLAQASVAALTALVPVVILLVLVGIGMALILVSARTLLQRSVEDSVLAKVLSVQEGVYLTGLTVGYLVGPALIAAFGPQRAFVPLGLAVVAIGVITHRRVRSLDLVAVVPVREIDLLAKVPFLAALPPYELERLAQGTHWERIAAGQNVVRQGDPADSYYLVSSGEFSVTVDGALREHTLSAGDGFGEIALLNRITRTATVTAITNGELLIVPSEAFLAAVTSSSDGESQAREISRARLELDRQSS
jgi:MFS family permease